MWNEAISAFSKQFEDACGMWILLTKYTADIYRGNIFPTIFFPQILYFLFFIKMSLGLNSTATVSLRMLIKMMKELSIERRNFSSLASLLSWIM